MSMQMIRARVPLSKKSKPKKKTAAVLEAERKLQETLKRVGYKGDVKRKAGIHSLPDLSVKSNAPLSNDVCRGGSKKEKPSYTGDELLGIALNHKSSFEPIRKDNKAAAVASAQMRRN